MKKIVLALCLLMGLALVGCGQKKDGKKVVLVGTNAEYAPFEYMEGDKYVGFDIELITEISKIAGFEVEYKNMSFDGLIPSLQSGKIDVAISSMTATDERRKAVDFSDTYYVTTQVLIVKEEDNSIKSFADLKGKNVGVELGTTSDILVTEDKEINTVRFNKSAEAILNLNSNKLNAIVMDGTQAKNYAAKNKGLKIVEVPAAKEEYAMAFPKGSEELEKSVNAALKTIKENGKYDEIYKKWFK